MHRERESLGQKTFRDRKEGLLRLIEQRLEEQCPAVWDEASQKRKNRRKDEEGSNTDYELIGGRLLFGLWH